MDTDCYDSDDAMLMEAVLDAENAQNVERCPLETTPQKQLSRQKTPGDDNTPAIALLLGDLIALVEKKCSSDDHGREISVDVDNEQPEGFNTPLKSMDEYNLQEKIPTKHAIIPSSKLPDDEFSSSDDEPLARLKKHDDMCGYNSESDPEYAPACDKRNSTDSEYSTGPDELIADLIHNKRKRNAPIKKKTNKTQKKESIVASKASQSENCQLLEEDHASRLENLLIANDLKMVEVEDNDNSFFSAISAQLPQYSANQLQHQATYELENNMGRYLKYIHPNQSNIDENDLYLDLLIILELVKEPGNWSTQVEDIVTMAMAEALTTSIITYSGDRTKPVVTIDPITKMLGKPPLILCRIKKSHLRNCFCACKHISNKDNIYSKTAVHCSTESDTPADVPQQTTSTRGSLEVGIEDINVTIEAREDECTMLSQATPQQSNSPCSGIVTHSDITPKKSSNQKIPSKTTPRKRAAFLTPPKKTRFRKMYAKPETWKCNVRKRLRLSGEGYISSKGKVVTAKELKPVNCEKCKFKCTLKISEEQRNSIFESFYQLANYEQQKQFICSNVVEKSTRTYLDSEMNPVQKRRNVSRRYSFLVEDLRIVVCKKFFMNTVCVGDAYIDHALSRNVHGIFTGGDNRGKHQPANKTRQKELDQVHKHIESFPVLEGHYTRSTSKRKYLQEGLNVTKMYELYMEFCKNSNLKHVSKGVYRKVFNEHFNYSFHVPKKDQCLMCTKYNQEMASKKQVSTQMEAEFTSHQQRKILAREQKANDKKLALGDRTVKTACFDLEAVLSAPCGLVSQLYYKRKLSCYNLSIYSLADNHGHNYIWNETEGGRGSCEIGTCLYLYLSSLPIHIQHIIFYSDSCTGQNRNKYVAAALLSFIKNATHLETIDHKFLETGHTQMECDSMHSAIEFAKKKTSIYIPSQWDTVIRMARRKNPYQVVPLKYSDIIDFKSVCRQLLKNTKTTICGTKVNWLQIKCIQFRKCSPNSIFVKLNHNESDFKEIRCAGTSKSRRSREVATDQLPPKYLKKLPISAAKKKDLIDLCSSGVIPEEFHPFYNKITGDAGISDRLAEPDFQENDEDTDND